MTLVGTIGNAAMFWSVSYKLSDTPMLLTESGALHRLAATPESADGLASDLGWHIEPLTRLLDLLVTAGVLDRSDARYSVPVATRAVLPVILLEARMRQWHATNQSLRAALVTGKGANPLEHLSDDSFLTCYQAAMAASARALALHLFRYGGLSKDGLVLDIGGADGALVEQLASLMPTASFRVIDRPVVREHFVERMQKSDHATRCSFQCDDITHPEALLGQAASASSMVISNVLHLLSGRQIEALLGSLKAAARTATRLVIYDQFMDATRLDTSRVMVVDWVNLGVGFDLHEGELEEMLRSFGYVSVSARRFPALPGALVCGTTP